MNVPSENIVGSCEYTPVYLIQSPVVTLPESYVVSKPTTFNGPKPVSDNLKRFYESSGNLENSLLHNDNTCKPRILKKHPIPVNGYKLSSFLTSKSKVQNNLDKKCIVSANNVVQKSSVTTSQTGIINVSSILNMDRKIVKLKNLPTNIKNIPRAGPKMKPKDMLINVPNNINLHNNNTVKPNITTNSISTKPKLTSVQLLKMGETYHSLNQLSDGQMKMVNQALKIFSDPEKIPVEPTYDPVTNTRFIYKVVSPKDLTIVGKNKIVIKQTDDKKVAPKTIEKSDNEIIDTKEQRSLLQAKVTRSGRTVKLPKQLVEEQRLLMKEEHEEVDENIDYCSQCCEEFKGLYNLKQENDDDETTSKINSSLFNYLLAIVKNAPELDQATIFIQQLEQLIEKLKLLLPCLLKKIGGTQGKQCTVNDDIGRLFNMKPGTYNLNMDALSCEKDEEGFCTHNPKKITPPVKLEINNTQPEKFKEDESEECIRIKPVSQWTVKRSWNPNQNKKIPKVLPKKIRLTSENTEPPIELGTEDQNCLNDILEQSTDNSTFKSHNLLDSQKTSDIAIDNIDLPTQMIGQNNLKGSHDQFYSAHFDIRSSPIKSTTGVFRKFLITPTTIPKCDVQIMKPLDNQNVINQMEEMQKEDLAPEINDLSILQEILKNDVEIPCTDREVNDVCQVLNFDDAKNWELTNNNEPPITNECTDSLIESALMHVTGDSTLDKTSDQIELTSNDSGQSVLNFLESLGNELAYPETEIRNNTIDFHLDLFSFHNS